MAWAKPEYSKRRVDRAGKEYAAGPHSLQEYVETMAIIDNWRSAHSFPLNTMQMLLRKRARTVDPAADVVQRLKRFPSIAAKLRKLGSFGLSNIQDIGGCRAVVKDMDRLDKLMDAFLLRGRDSHVLKGIDDYVWDDGPRSTGYRSVHFIYAFQSDANPDYNSLRIEIQLRTRRQHAWATAVETVAAFTGEPLKSGEGDPEWLRFFALMGSEIAGLERAPLVPQTPRRSSILRAEIRDLARKLDVENRLRAYQATMDIMGKAFGEGADTYKLHYFLLCRNAVGRELDVTGYAKTALRFATQDYKNLELATANTPEADVVLVSADDLKALKRAYPNYFADTSEFLKMLNRAIS